ncbi:amine dehydrogenase [Cupriavidus necator]|uniref:Amine dehydrogenase n=1 Tax=Cupriavidus necator TaxID=106590 RepID=A0A1U9UW13_CUPNE|nr:amine dehydrogenase large subunit [Cupriavidus necator]AQV96884.1 amine dehydrogenase [Cupriavidus necator]
MKHTSRRASRAVSTLRLASSATLAAFLGLSLAMAASAASAADLPPETLTMAKLAPADENRLYISDVAFHHMVDGRLHVVDGKQMKYLGLVPTGFGGQSLLSPDKRTIYVVSTFYPRLSRGERTDVVSLYDADTLAYGSEIVIPPRHAQSLNYRGIIATSADGRFLYVQNATPATSVSIVDLKENKLASEVQTPGCWGIFASAASSQRFQALCSDGAMLTVTHDVNGQPAGQKRSARMFDPQQDPVFLHSERVGNTLYFVSFNGNVYTADVSGETPSFGKPWPIVSAADAKAGWKPGGYQLFALHAATQRLYVGMHPKSREGSHKTPAAEIWTIDLASRTRVARAPGQNALALTITQGASPTLYALDAAKAGVVALDPASRLKPVARLDGVSENAVQVEAHQ